MHRHFHRLILILRDFTTTIYYSDGRFQEKLVGAESNRVEVSNKSGAGRFTENFGGYP